MTLGAMLGSIRVRSSGVTLLAGLCCFKNAKISAMDGRLRGEEEQHRLMKIHRLLSIPPPPGREGMRPCLSSLMISSDFKSCQGKHPEKI